MIKTALTLLAFAVANASARNPVVRAKTAPMAPLSASFPLTAPAASPGLIGSLAIASLNAPTLPEIPSPLPAAVRSAKPEALSAPAPAATRESLAAIRTAVEKTRKNGADAGVPIARAYDGGAKRESTSADAGGVAAAAPAVSAAGRLAPRSFGLGRSNFADAPVRRAPVASPQIRREVRYAPIPWRRAAAGFLIWLALMGAVALEYGGIYYAVTHAPRAQPTEADLYSREFQDGLRDLGF